VWRANDTHPSRKHGPGSAIADPEETREMNPNPGATGTSTEDERSLSELSKDLANQTSALAQKEIELAKAELTEKGKRLGVGAGAFGAAGLIGLYALGALTAAAILGLAIVVDAWLAALIVAALYGAIAGILALTGKQKVEEGTPPVPEEAIESTKADVRHTTQRAKEARS
jgi:Putative Actinobacterial Holin-X, holin superfamily III